MNESRLPPDIYCFPTPPARIDRTLNEAPLLPAVAATYLFDIRRWRDRVVIAVAAGDPAIAGIESLTLRARDRLALLLESSWDARARREAAASCYGLTPFPATRPPARVEDPMRAVLEVLHWRAAVVNYLTDVWDVLGKPELEMGECVAIGMFLRPARLEGRCIFCLTEYGADRIDPEDHGCVLVKHVRAM